LVKEALKIISNAQTTDGEVLEIGCVVTSLVVGRLVGFHARALWPNAAS